MNAPIDALAKLRAGYGRLIGAGAAAFDAPGFVLAAVERRAEVAWGENWYQPVWVVRLGHTTVCAAAPEYAPSAQAIFASWQEESLLSAALEAQVQQCFSPIGWQRLEILYYPQAAPPPYDLRHRVAKLEPQHPAYAEYAREFSGGTHVILDADHQIIAWAGIKDHGDLFEIAVGTEPAYRKQGMGKAVTACATADILLRSGAAVYVPDALNNEGSYALARSVGFEKIGEMLLWEIQR